MKIYRFRIVYTNWRGETSLRVVVPLRFYIGEYEKHEGVQWLMDAVDVDPSKGHRTFALKDIHWWDFEGEYTDEIREAGHPEAVPPGRSGDALGRLETPGSGGV